MRHFKEVYAGPVTPLDLAGQTDPTRLVLTGDLRLENPLPPGEYVLQVMAHDKLAPAKYRTASQWIDLEVVK